MRAKLVAVLLPVLFLGAVVAAPVPKDNTIPPVNKKHLKASSDNLRNVAIAIHNYAGANKQELPGNIYSKDGKPLLSWRVTILPHMDREELYKQFKLDEPWDSEHNKKLVEKMPKVYAPIRVKTEAGKTFYQTFTGENALFGDKGPTCTLVSINDGSSNTLLVVEAGEPVIWTKPEDLPFDAEKPLPKLGGLFDGDFNVVWGDGHVSTFKKDFDADEMKKVIQPGDGIPVDLTKLKKRRR